MDQFQQELAEMARVAQLGGQPLPSDKQNSTNLQNYSHEELIKMYQDLMSGKMPPDLNNYYQSNLDKNGKPIIDEEGGSIVQPVAGFVVKTKDENGAKVFVNMTQHEVVDPFEQKAIPQGDRDKYDGQEQGIRIPLSLGTLKEDFDKKGNPAQVYDIIWNPKTIERCKTDPAFRQIVIELAFNYIQQKFKHVLSMKFTIPKMKYKGKTIEYQRVRAKKGPKIQEVEMSEEERKALEAKGLQQQKQIQAQRLEQEPQWKLYTVLKLVDSAQYESQSYWSGYIRKKIEIGEEKGVGDINDRISAISQLFELDEEEDLLEEFDGLNQETAQGLIILVSLPLLMRAHAIDIKVTGDFIRILVPNIYKLELGLPIQIDKEKVCSFFDCKLRKLIVFLPQFKEEIIVEEQEEEIKVVDTKRLDDDLLFDVV